MRLIYLRKSKEIDGVWSFYFKPVDKVQWTAGQSIRLELKRPTYGIDERRFTISSAPHEKMVRITTRVGDSRFKQALKNLKHGDEIDGYAVEGDVVWGNSQRHRLFLAAGIGITPIRSMLADRLHSHKPTNATLLYSSSQEPILFKKELDAWQKQDPTLLIHYLVGKRIEIEPNTTLLPQWLDSVVYISGPSPMVDKLSDTLLQAGLTEDSLKRDWFTGYQE